MSSNLMKTEKGGEQTQYESITSTAPPHSKSGGQMGSVETTEDPEKTEEGKAAKRAHGEKTAENVRYGQGISETVGDTINQTGKADVGGDEKADGRAAAGYGGGSGVGA
ncbi:uncharacterized protein RCC_03214 [Ramularia collo-cygni]|uniref:Uncharacterized protein n=1 Tax=Ramularia collo-cygni TaxID=112498 RepID=A0A2D3UWA9_9PEZI|nr:uncharacterized protein RCC_03214 [Ramularia collo-cygni]CZT17380.1 uncharacterized protein RCC_03214 [Ramularia collo-cygni]